VHSSSKSARSVMTHQRQQTATRGRSPRRDGRPRRWLTLTRRRRTESSGVTYRVSGAHAAARLRTARQFGCVTQRPGQVESFQHFHDLLGRLHFSLFGWAALQHRQRTRREASTAAGGEANDIVSDSSRARKRALFHVRHRAATCASPGRLPWPPTDGSKNGPMRIGESWAPKPVTTSHPRCEHRRGSNLAIGMLSLQHA
jgi:hypothetical protein